MLTNSIFRGFLDCPARTMAEQVLELAKTSLNELAIAAHCNNYIKLIVHVDDDGVIDDAFLSEDTDRYDSRRNGYQMLFCAGTGSTPCNCDACQNGDDPADWAGDDSDTLCHIEDELDERIAELDCNN